MADASLAVIIVTYNSRREIGACLSSLFADLGARPAQVVVVDNASTDGTAEYLAEHWRQVTVLAQRENRGFAAANNFGLANTNANAALLLNPDTVVQPGALDALLATLAAHPDAGVVGPMLLNRDDSLQLSCRDFPTLFGDFIGMTELYRVGAVRRLFAQRLVSLTDHRVARYVDWLSGACLLVRRAAVDTVGLMDEGFFMYAEEMDWQYRMVRRGWRVWFEPSARVMHLGGASTAATSAQRIVWQYQSMWRFYHLHRDAGQRLVLRWIIWIATLPKIIVLALASRGNAHRRELLRTFWQVLWLS